MYSFTFLLCQILKADALRYQEQKDFSITLLNSIWEIIDSKLQALVENDKV